MWGGVVLAPEGDLAQVGAVAQDAEHRRDVEGLSLARARAFLGQPLGNRRGALAAFGVAAEDLRHHGSLGRLGDEEAPLVVKSVAEGDVAADPLSPFCLSFHPGDRAFDNRRPLELGEDAEHLHHHPSRGAGGVEGLGRRAEEHVGRVEAVENLRQPAHRPREPVHPVDEQEVEAPRLGLAERPFQPRPLQDRARRLIGEAAHDLPVLLAFGIGIKPRRLRLKRVGLGLLVGRDAGVDGDPHRLLRRLRGSDGCL